MNVTHYDLFAGIGGFSYALDTIFNEHNIEHIFCEWEAFPTAVPKRHWPEATFYGDIAELVADTECSKPSGSRQRGKSSQSTQLAARRTGRIDHCHHTTILTGGFPCQPFSHAGRRQGTADDRYKWPDMFAVIRNVRPEWVVAENVRGLATWNNGLVLETVCSDLESEGYEVQPLVIPACAVGAPHRRDRIWIVAHRHMLGNRAGFGSFQETHGEIPERNDHAKPRDPNKQWSMDWGEVAFATCHDRVDDGISRWLDGVPISAARHRKERLKACGNAIVPQVAMEIFQAIKQCLSKPRSGGDS